MSYLVLARKYRPKNFENLVGQDHVVKALTHALETQRLHHAYLFTGTRGVGKTTLSRLLAKSLNCEKGITSQPCGTCEACLAIDAGYFVDYIEMDAASNRGIAEMLQLLEQAVYMPTSARFKVYMIDEVHMLTREAFNAMLKTLEEPPSHVKFILATTDPQKIPVTVLSRCLQFNLKQMPPLQIVEYLESVLKEEQVLFEKTALRLLAEGASGSMRDALSLTDQAIAYTAGNISLAAVQDMLGTLDQTYLIRILDALMKKDGADLINVADEMFFRSLSFSSALKDLAVLLNRIALVQKVPSALSDDLPEYEAILKFAKTFHEQDIQLLYQIAIHGKNELGIAPDEYSGFTMTLLRMLAFQPGTRESVPLANQSDFALEEKADLAKSVTSKSSMMQSNMAQTKTVVNETTSLGKNSRIESFHQENSEKKTAISSDKVLQEKLSLNWDGNWTGLIRKLPLNGLAKQLAQQSELIDCVRKGKVLHFHLRAPNKLFLTPASIEKLKNELVQSLGCAIDLTTEIGEVKHTAISQAEEVILNNPFVKELMSEFGATLVPNSIKFI